MPHLWRQVRPGKVEGQPLDEEAWHLAEDAQIRTDCTLKFHFVNFDVILSCFFHVNKICFVISGFCFHLLGVVVATGWYVLIKYQLQIWQNNLD